MLDELEIKLIMAILRTFIAIEMPESIRQKIQNLQAELKSFPAKVTWVKPENIHLTLKFLGDTEDNTIDSIGDQLAISAASFSPFKINIGGVGAFPNFKQPRVFWVGSPTGADKLVEIAAEIDQRMNTLGFETDKRKYSAHFTIARVRDSRGIGPMVKSLQSKHDFDAGEFIVNKISLIKSELTPQGPIYSVLKTVGLKQ